MATKKNIQPWFPQYASLNTEKILMLRTAYKMEGFGIYVALKERLRCSDDFTFSLNYELLATDLGCDADMVKSVILDFGLFEVLDGGERFHCVELTEQMQNMQESRKRRAEAAKKAAIARWSEQSKTKETPKGEPSALVSDESDMNQKHEQSWDSGLAAELKELAEDKDWLSYIAQQRNITVDKVLSYMPAFKEKCLSAGKNNGHPNKDCKQHFVAFIDKRLPAQSKRQHSLDENNQSKNKQNQEKKKPQIPQSLENRYRNKGYEPDCVPFRQFTDEWRSQNPAPHPEWIDLFKGKEAIEDVQHIINIRLGILEAIETEPV